MEDHIGVPSSRLPSEDYRKLVMKLLSGAVVCRWSEPGLARLLEQAEVRNRINRWVGEMGMSLAQTSSEQGYYLIYSEFDATVKSAARELFTRVMKELRFYVRVLELMMNSLHPDTSLQPGEDVRFPHLLNQISQSPSLQTHLGELSSSKKHSAVKDQLESLFNRLLKEGILVEANKKHSIYQVTARIELIQDIIIFIQENENLPEAEPDSPGIRQGQLT